MQKKALAELQPHPRQAEIYGDEPADRELVASIKAHGILEPIIATPDGVILAGHRRVRAAERAGLQLVPVEVRDNLSEVEQLAVLVESNRQRVKTTRQIGREAIALQEVERERARLRQVAAQNNERGRSVRAKLPTLENTEKNEQKGRATGVVARHLGMGRRTVEKLIEVERKIETLDENGHTEEARRLEKTLNYKSINAAYNQVKPPSAKPREPKPPRTVPESPKGRVVTQDYARDLLIDLGCCALTSLSRGAMTDESARALIWKHIRQDGDSVTYQAIAILINKWPLEGSSFFIATVNALKSRGIGNGASNRSGHAAPAAGKYRDRR